MAALAARAGIPIIGYRTWSLAPSHDGEYQDSVIRAAAAADAAALAIPIARA